jgi:hypothetical protein
MRSFPIAIGLALTLAGPTLAQAASQSAKMTGQEQSQTQPHNTQSMRQQVQDNLQKAGFTDIKVMPESFLVRAKDKDGNPIMMVINPDSVTALTEYNGKSSTDGSASSNGTSGAHQK